MDPRFVSIVGIHLLGSLTFTGIAVRNALLGDTVGAVLQGVLAVLVITMGVGLARAL